MKKILLSLIAIFALMSCEDTNDYNVSNDIDNINIKVESFQTASRIGYGSIDILLKTSGKYPMYFSSNDEIMIYNPQNKTKGLYHYQNNSWLDAQPKAQWSVNWGENENIVCAYPYNRVVVNGSVVTFDVDLKPENFGQLDGYYCEAYPNNSKNCPIYLAGMNNITRESREGGTSNYDTNYIKLKYYSSQFVIQPSMDWKYVEQIIVRNENLTNKFTITIDENNNGTVKQIGNKSDYVINVANFRGINNCFMNKNPFLVTLPPLSGETKVYIRYKDDQGNKTQDVLTVKETNTNEKYV